jgi:Flp pilus assembly protein TadD
LFSSYRPRPTVIGQPAPEYTARDAASVQFALARTLEGEKNWKAAEQVYRRILEQNPKHADAAHRLAILCDRQNRFQESEKFFRQALKERPGDPNLFCDIGYSHYRQRRWADAEMNLKQATAIEKAHARAHNHLGLLYAQLDRRQDSLKEFQLAGCNASQAHTNVALVLSLNDRLEDAQKEYVAALNADPTSDEVRSRLQKIESVLAMSRPAAPQRTQTPRVQMARHSAAPADLKPAVATASHSEGGKRKAESGKRKAEGGKRKAAFRPPTSDLRPPTTPVRKTTPAAANSFRQFPQPAVKTPAAPPKAVQPAPIATPPARRVVRPAPRDRFWPPKTDSSQPKAEPADAPAPKGRVRLVPDDVPELQIIPNDSGSDSRTSLRDEFRPVPRKPQSPPPAFSRPVERGIQPVSHERVKQPDLTPVRPATYHLRPIGGPRPTRTRTVNGLIDVESIVSPVPVSKPERIVID